MTKGIKNKATGTKTTFQGYGRLKGPNQAFLDAEYLSGRSKKGSLEDVISIGFVITDQAHKELARYYSTIQLVKGHRLTPIIMELTGLTNQELEASPGYETVMMEAINLLKHYKVGKIFVWGGDKTSFQHDFLSRSLSPAIYKEIARFINSFENIQKEVSLDVTGGLDQGLSLADLKTLCGLGGHVAHNALNDAEDLLDCICVIEQGQMVYDGAEAARYKSFRGEYIKNRSFDDDQEDIFFCFESQAGKKLLAELKDKGFENNPKTKAFMDDLTFLMGQGNAHMGTFAEAMAEKEEGDRL